MTVHALAIRDGVWPTMITPFNEDKTIDWGGVDALTDWYVEAGVAGIFAVCLSSEFYELCSDERIGLASRVVRRAGGRVPVVASGTFGGPIDSQAQFVRRMADTGVSAVVVLTCQLAGEQEGNRQWLANAERLQDLASDVSLGLYECPSPYARLMPAELMGTLAATGRFTFHKDTSCDPEAIVAKIEAMRGTRFKFFNANLPTLLESLSAGGNGYCGIAANLYPELIAWLCDRYQDMPEETGRLQRLLTVADAVSHHKYPTSAKAFLRLRGLEIKPVCRTQDVVLDGREMRTLQHLLGCVQDVAAGLRL